MPIPKDYVKSPSEQLRQLQETISAVMVEIERLPGPSSELCVITCEHREPRPNYRSNSVRRLGVNLVSFFGAAGAATKSIFEAET
jgi:hypothetical protein